MLKENTPAPTFEIKNDQDELVTLESLLISKYLLMYFYPRDNTPGCTVEAQAMRDMMTELKSAGITIVGISTDSVKSHQGFKDKYNLPFTLLADTEKDLVEKYKVMSTFGTAKRTSYLIDDSGTIVKKYPKVSPAMHASEVINDVNSL